MSSPVSSRSLRAGWTIAPHCKDGAFGFTSLLLHALALVSSRRLESGRGMAAREAQPSRATQSLIINSQHRLSGRHEPFGPTPATRRKEPRAAAWPRQPGWLAAAVPGTGFAIPAVGPARSRSRSRQIGRAHV